MSGEQGAPGTAGRNYKTDPQPHRFERDAVDYGHATVCRHCQQGRQHPNHRGQS